MRTVFLLGMVALLTGLPQWLQAQSNGSESSPARLGSADYLVRPGDVLRIRVWPDSALSGEFPIEETGVAHLPVLGQVQAGGLTLTALRDRLRQRYGESLREAVVSVTPLFRVSVLGAVQRPGLYQVDPTQSLFDVISLAGGFRENADQEDLRIVREGEVVSINAEEAMQTGAADLALSLRSGDRIVVPEGRSFRAVDIFYGIQSVVLLITLLTRI